MSYFRFNIWCVNFLGNALEKGIFSIPEMGKLWGRLDSEATSLGEGKLRI